MKFVWDDEDADIGRYYLYLMDGDKKLDELSIVDYTSDFHQRYDKKTSFLDPMHFK